MRTEIDAFENAVKRILYKEFVEKLKGLDTWSTDGHWDCYKQIDILIEEYQEKLK